ncbi:arginine repressor [Eubacterium sp. 14-2]|uniref:arginine repressor n=1 Tax=Eubacterium sp. 14-2 TaxID=1235790 RepID=UPI000340C6F4|nr:arginine repressor [Eubacterium sp. 14-2]EOT21653.1 arginine repressor [Eubacterium sp. 14-2]
MKSKRQAKILEIISKYNIKTQEELSEHLEQEGFHVTQATVSRDIRELKLTRVAGGAGQQKYISLQEQHVDLSEKYTRIFREGFVSMDMAQNILVIKTVSGMAMAVAAALDAMDCHEIVGSIAGDDTIMCAVRTLEDTESLMKRLRKITES